MGGTAIRLALAAWVRHPREMGLANLGLFLAAALPLPLLLLGQGSGRRWGLVFWVAWAWLCFSALAAACAQILAGTFSIRTLGAWLRRHAAERLGILILALLLLAWIALALDFYLRLGLPTWATVPVLALLGSLAVWAAAALLASVGVAALEARTLVSAWKASALLPLAFAPAWIGAGLLALALSGLPALAVGLRHWSAPLLFAPLALSPLFTAAFFAAYLVLLVRGSAERAAGGEGPLAPAWRELWSPWR